MMCRFPDCGALACRCRPNRVKTERPSPDVDTVYHAWTERVIVPSILTIPAG